MAAFPPVVDLVLNKLTVVAGLVVLAAACANSNETTITSAQNPAVATENRDSSYRPLAPFAAHEERYRQLFMTLTERGMEPERIRLIFASAKAKRRDTAAIDRLSVKRSGIATLKSPAQLAAIGGQLARHIERNRKDYDVLEQRFGVNREIAAAILFKETHLGQFDNWQHEAFVVFNNILSFMEPSSAAGERERKRMERLIAIAQQSLSELLLFCENHHIDIVETAFPSSFAGAIGMPQFLPLYLDYAVSAGHTTPDLDQTGDALLSLGNLLQNRFDWPGPMQLERLQAIDEIYRRYAGYDSRTKDASFCMPLDQDGFPLRSFAAEHDDIAGIDYIARYASVLMQYNFSSYYVLDVLQLAFHSHRLRARQ